MKIVVLDGYTLNPGDLSWAGLESLGDCEVYERTPPDMVLERTANVEIVMTNKTVLDRNIIRALPKLKYIGVLATGVNVVDVYTATERGIPVTNVPAYGTKSVAQMTFALVLELTQRVGHHAQSVRNGRWSSAKDWSYWDSPLVELAELTLGIVGFGRIGRAVAELAAAFGMTVLVHTRTPPDGAPAFVRFADLEDLFRQSDVISLHCPLTPETRGFVNVERLAWMKTSAFLVNTSRGPLIDEPALADALNTDRLAGAGLDVLSVEPPPASNPLLRAKNCLITPHMAWATQAARARLMNAAVENIRAYLAGRPINVVNNVS